MKFEDLVTKQDLNVFRQEMIELISELKNSSTAPKEFLTQPETMEYLDCSYNTLRTYHRSGDLKPKKVGSKVYYKMTEIRKMLSV